MKHVVVLCGGRSAEHEVSLISALLVLKHLNQEKYQVSVLAIEKDGSLYPPEAASDKLGLSSSGPLNFPAGKHWVSVLLELNPVPDIVFPVLHGPFGEDGTIQGTLEVLDIPYVGAGVSASAVAMSKVHSKEVLRGAGFFLTRIMHKFSTAPTNSSALPAFRSVGLLNLPYSTFAGADPQAGTPARGATHSGQRFRRFVTRTYA